MTQVIGPEGAQMWDEPPPPDDPLAAWIEERNQFHPDSFEYQQISAALVALGAKLPDEEAATPVAPGTLQVPPGFSEVVPLDPAIVPAWQFQRRVPGLFHRKAIYKSPVAELITDGGHRLRLLDLRGVLSHALEDIAPSPPDQERLDERFYRDLGVLARTGTPRRTVRSTSRHTLSAAYSMILGTKLRAFYTNVATENHSGDGVRVVARIGDCGNDESKEAALYRRLFNRTFRMRD